MDRPKFSVALLIGLISFGGLARSQDGPPILLWPTGAPGAHGTEAKDKPTLTPYTLTSTHGKASAVVICPGGGYVYLAAHEGKDYAIFLNNHGLNAFVLQYRLGSDGYRYPAQLQDIARAVRLVRARAIEWGIDPGKIGVMGSSAGGHLASTILTHFDAGNANSPDSIDQKSSRPDFGILCYPVISMGEIAHAGSRQALLGETPDPILIDELSNEKHVSPQTPPCFLWHTSADNVVSVQNSLTFASSLQKNGIPFDLHIYTNGGHGMGLGDTPPFRNPHPWTRDLLFWLKEKGLTWEE